MVYSPRKVKIGTKLSPTLLLKAYPVNPVGVVERIMHQLDIAEVRTTCILEKSG
jgi:hypothetical protein